MACECGCGSCNGVSDLPLTAAEAAAAGAPQPYGAQVDQLADMRRRRHHRSRDLFLLAAVLVAVVLLVRS